LGEDDRKVTSVISRGSKAGGYAFDPEVVAILISAYHAVFAELGLSDSDEVVALRVARPILEQEKRGEERRKIEWGHVSSSERKFGPNLPPRKGCYFLLQEDA
jgi:hypothetical protein